MSKMVDRASAGMPIPVSRTVTSRAFWPRWAVSQILPPRSVYFAAFTRRFERIWALDERSPLLVRGLPEHLPEGPPSISDRGRPNHSSY
jgi:hypothetical protein